MKNTPAASSQSTIRETALKFVILIGILSFFADFTYEGSRSILGPYKENRMKDKLNQSQWNSLRIAVSTFEKNLRAAQAWLDGMEENGAFYRRKLRLSAKRRKQATQQIAGALQTVTQLGQSLDLPIKDENIAFEIRSQMVISWTELLDNRTGKLKRYGKVHPELASTLDPTILQLAEMALNLSALFEGSEQEK